MTHPHFYVMNTIRISGCYFILSSYKEEERAFSRLVINSKHYLQYL